MRDLELWRRLTSGESDVAPLLTELAVLPLKRRAPFLGLAAQRLADPAAEVRVAVLRVLAGVTQRGGVERIVGALDDEDASVRLAAVAALLDTARTAPARWAHALFHPRLDVRRAALAADPPTKAAYLVDYLRADPELRERATEAGGPAVPLVLALDLYARGHMDGPQAAYAVSQSPADVLRSVLEGSYRRTPEQLDAFTSAAERSATLPAPEGRDVLDLWCEVVHSTPDARSVSYARLADAVLGPKLGPLQVRCLAAVSLWGAAKGWTREAVDLCTACHPSFLLWRSVDVAMRRDSAPVLLHERERMRPAPADLAPRLLVSDLCRRSDGELDIAVLCSVASLIHARKIGTLVDTFGREAIVLAMMTQPQSWPVMAMLPDEPRSGPMWFLERARHRDMGTYARLVAIGLPTWIAGLDLKAELEKKHGPRGRPPLAVRVLSDLDSATASDVLVAFAQSIDDGRIEPGDKTFTKIVDELDRRIAANRLPDTLEHLLDRPTDSTAVRVLDRIARRRTGAGFSRAAVDLPTPALLALLDLLTGPPEGGPAKLELQRSKEYDLAQRCKDHADASVAAWADRFLGSLHTPTVAKKTAIAGVRLLRREEADAITSASEADLEKALGPTLVQPSRGLVDALRERAAPDHPRLDVCVALLGAGDDLAAVDEQMGRFGNDDATFAEQLHAAAVTIWQARRELPPLGHAVLHRWELHGFELLGWVDGLRGTLAEALRATLDLDCGIVRQFMWEGLASIVRLRAYRQAKKLGPFATAEVLELLVAQLDTELGVPAAQMLVAMFLKGLAAEHYARLRQRVLDAAPDMSRSTLRELDRWIRVEGMRTRDAPARQHRAKVAADAILDIRGTDDLGRLENLCRHGHPHLVHEATLRLIELGSRGQALLVELVAEEPRLPCATTIVESIALWSDEAAVSRIRELSTDPGQRPELRFRLAMALVERGETDKFEDALDAAAEPTDRSWLTRKDWDALVRRGPGLDVVAPRLATSPHPHAHQKSVEWLLSEAKPSDVVDEALAGFLEQGTARLLYLRRKAARALFARGDHRGLVILLEQAMDPDDKHEPRFLHELPYGPGLDAAAQALLDAALLGGPAACPEARVYELTASATAPAGTRETATRRLLTDGADAAVREKAVAAIGPTLGRRIKLGHVAEIFAWGVRKGRELTGRLFRVHMTSRRQDFGYTRLNESRIFVSPLPVLKGDRHGRDIVEALILHEYGHHMYHRGKSAAVWWRRAQKKKLHGLMNLVADEHLERNLRAIDAVYGDRLKRLASYAFQHSDREFKVERLVGMLQGASFPALSTRPLGVAFDSESVELRGGLLLRELDRRGEPFARFVRALRMGMGDRYGDDPQLEEALALFKNRFRHSDMKRIYEITLRLSEIYGSAANLAQAFGGHESLEWDEREGTIHGEGVDDDAVQREIERILDPRRKKPTPGEHPKGGGRLAIRVSGETHFDKITHVERLAVDAAAHREVALEVRRYSERLRGYLTELGLALVPRRGRLRGRAFDRTRARAVVLRRDPRMLVAREVEVHSDLFIGVVVDCSGSMSSGGSMHKAHRFGVLLAEAAKALPGVDARFFGFTDRIIYDAGDERHCAVTSMQAGGGNNDAAGLYYAAEVAAASPRKCKLLVMISDGLPTECSVQALKALVDVLTRRKGILCAQVAVRPLSEECFPYYIELTEHELEVSVRRFGEIVTGLARRALGR